MKNRRLRKKSAKKKRSWSLSLTLSVAFLLLILTLLLVSGGVGTFFTVRTQQEIAFARQQLIAYDASHKVSAFIQEKFGALETSARLIDPALVSGREAERILYSLLGLQPALRRLVLFNREKRRMMLASRLAMSVSTGFDRRMLDDLFASTGRGKKYISSIYVDETTCEPMLLIAVPVLDPFGDYQGALAAEVNLKFMWDLVAALRIGEGGAAYVVDRQGKLTAFGDISRVLRGENEGGLEIVKDFIASAGSPGTTEAKVFSGINGEPVLGTFVALGAPDWALVTEIPLGEAYRSVVRVIAATVAVMLFMGVLAGVASLRLARRLSVPIVRLMTTAARIAAGDLGVRAEAGGPSEISNLATAFNSMTDRLAAVICDLKKRDRYLQETVEKYVAYMAEVGKGRFDGRLELDVPANGEYDEPLIVLGKQLNDTTAKLREIIGQIRETTDKLERNERTLRVYSEDLMRSNRDLEQFAFIVSHDLQEPLRKIRYFSDRLKTDCGGHLNEKARDDMERIQNAVKRMANLIRDLLQYSRVSSTSRSFARVDLNKVVKGVLSDLEFGIAENRAEIRTDALPSIDADPILMRQLFQNLIGNAIKYHRKSVPPVVRVNLDATEPNERDFCRIRIIDNGIGFDNKYAEKIFGLFQRLHGRDEYEGAGLGLAICKKIVELHGGSIRASSREGEGSTFYVRLPLKHEERGNNP